MAAWRLMALGAAIFAASTVAGNAGPCSAEIDRLQVRIDARLEARAAAGPSATESSTALTHHQPTPGSIAAAEEKVDALSPQKVDAVKQAMARAHAADSTGDKAACEQALAEVRSTIGE